MNPVSLIAKKRDKLELSSAEIEFLVQGLLTGNVTDYQMSAWLMAAWLNGLLPKETLALTQAMLHSGKVLTLPSVRGPKIDKHSTGGVGDKISICLAPLVAAAGVFVPMVSGRGLGHTGGTLDKLEAISGYQTRLTAKQFERVVRTVKTSMIGQTDEIAPADRLIYALRDVTATVESVPLITASILSKKLAEGIDGLVLDVKVGRGAFMPNLKAARELASSLVRVGTLAGKRVTALLTDMDSPIGLTIGNALETREAIEVLRDQGPADSRELTLLLGAEMLILAGVAKNEKSARILLERKLADGSAMETFLRMVKAHGGDIKQVEDPSKLPSTKQRVPITAKTSGYVQDIDPKSLAWIALEMGAGRTSAEQSIDPAVGIEIVKPYGAPVVQGEILAYLHVHEKRQGKTFESRVEKAFVVAPRKPKTRTLLLDRIEGNAPKSKSRKS
jgi:pyrimidine-nucleoside phosphorylase